MRKIIPIFVLINILMKTSPQPPRRILREAEESCPKEKVLTEKGCVDYFEPGTCPFGQRLYKNEDGIGQCDCLQGFGRNGSTCYQDRTKGPCADTEYLVINGKVTHFWKSLI